MSKTLGLDPQFRRQLLGLVERHKELRDEPLHLALTFTPERDFGDVFLLEIATNDFDDEFSSSARFFEVTYGPWEDFPMRSGQRLHLILTASNEFRRALRENWVSIEELRVADRRGHVEVLFQDELGEQLMAELRHD